MLTEEQTQLLLGNKPSVVGGIFYKPYQTLTDIYGDDIDLNTITSYEHTPVNYGSVRSEYSAPYSGFKESTSDSTKESSDSEVPAAQAIVIDTPTGETESAIENSAILNGKSDFRKLEKVYETELKKRGIDTAYARWLAAQDALESGWGKSQGARRHNYGNLTTGSDWKGKSFTGDDHDAKGNKIKHNFRAYDSVEEYVEDKLNFFNYKRYKDAFIGDPSKFIERIFNAGYAVDPNYVKAVTSVYNTWNK